MSERIRNVITGAVALVTTPAPVGGFGRAHMPAELSDSQWQYVRIYRAGSPAGKLIEAVVFVGDKGDAVIREATSSQPTDILEKIRELVCE